MSEVQQEVPAPTLAQLKPGSWDKWHLEAGLGWICKTRIDEPTFEREILLTQTSPR